MKRARLRKRKGLKKGTGLKRKTRLRAKGGSAFPHRRDPKYMAWLRQRVLEGWPCDACEWAWATIRAHLTPQGRAGDDRYNVALLCPGCDARCEKRAQTFCEEMGVDLFMKARAHTEEYLAEAA